MFDEHSQLRDTQSHNHLVFMEANDASLNTLVHQGHRIGLINNGDKRLSQLFRKALLEWKKNSELESQKVP